MKLPSICCTSTAAVIVPQQNPVAVPRTPPNTPNNSPVTSSENIKATLPEKAHLFRMIDSHGKCQEVDIGVVNRITMQRIEQQRRERILSTFLQGMNDE